jgi:hypothetical protein
MQGWYAWIVTTAKPIFTLVERTFSTIIMGFLTFAVDIAAWHKPTNQLSGRFVFFVGSWEKKT